MAGAGIAERFSLGSFSGAAVVVGDGEKKNGGRRKRLRAELIILKGIKEVPSGSLTLSARG